MQLPSVCREIEGISPRTIMGICVSRDRRQFPEAANAIKTSTVSSSVQLESIPRQTSRTITSSVDSSDMDNSAQFVKLLAKGQAFSSPSSPSTRKKSRKTSTFSSVN